MVDKDSNEGSAACVESKLSRELAKQAVITKCRGNIIAQPAVPLKKPCPSVPKYKICANHNIFDIKNLCQSVLICGQKRIQWPAHGFYRPQIITDFHRLRAKGSERLKD